MSRMRRNGTVDSLADLAVVAECVDSIEHMAGGLNRVSSLKDLASDLSTLAGQMNQQMESGMMSRTSSQLQLPSSLSRIASLADLSSISRVGSLADVANFVAAQQGGTYGVGA